MLFSTCLFIFVKCNQILTMTFCYIGYDFSIFRTQCDKVTIRIVSIFKIMPREIYKDKKAVRSRKMGNGIFFNCYNCAVSKLKKLTLIFIYRALTM